MKTFKDVMEGLKVIGGAGTATIALAGAAIGIGKIFCSLIHSVAWSFALMEAIALFALLMAFLILFVF
ncbi:putative F/V-ATP synthase subunit C superfamily [Helianthus annuus]|nr:putative F/V-ATP synthase subunit C superfamily [Helianthus annuus]